jgi:hypothetical protein
MSEKRDNSHWFIILAIIIIILIAIAYSSVNTANYDEREAEIKRRNEEEQKLVKEIDELNTKLEIYTKHESKNAFTEEYLKEICEKRYHQLIQVLIVSLVLSNALIFWLVPNLKVLDLFQWNGVAAILLNGTAIFFFASVKNGKEYLKGIVMNYIEFRVYENRDKTYFIKKVEFYRNEIDRLQLELENKANNLNHLRNNLSSLKDE